MAHKKAGSASTNGRDSAGRRLGIKKSGGSRVIPGNIIIRQRGTSVHPGLNVGMGKDHTLFAKIAGIVKFKKGNGDRNQIIRMVRPGQYFGYRAYFANENYVTSSAAIENTQIGFLPMTIVEDHVRRNNDLAFFFILSLANYLGQSDTRTVNLT